MGVSFVARKCTQCAGRLQYIKEKKLWKCLYCGAEIERQEQYDGLFTIKNVVRQCLLDTAFRRLDSAAKNLVECEKIDSRYVGTLIAKITHEMISVITPGACSERDVRNLFAQLKKNYELLRGISPTVTEEEEVLYEFLEEPDIFATLVLVYDSLNDSARRDYVLQMLDAKQVYSKDANGNLLTYLQNTEYWLAYCISAVMLWASNEPEAAQRAMSKSLSVNYFNSCLFYLLINLRFNRIEAAKKWYVNYLDRADMNDLGDEWQYLLQAYLFGAFGSDEEFQNIVAQCFQNMLGQVEVTTVDFAKKFTKKAIEFAELYVHKSELEYTTLRRTCSEYSEMHSLLSTAEKNAEIAKYYDSLSNAEGTEGEDLSQRIENVLYSLVNDYDDDELKVVQKIKYNEAVINARGDIAIAQANYDAMFAEQQKKKNLGDLLLSWAFADDSSQADVSVKRFSISFMKEAIAKGFEKFVESYRAKEKEKYTFTIDDCTLTCGEDDLAEAEKKLDAHYDKNKLRDTFKDKFVLIYSVMCAASVVLLLVLLAYFSPVILTIAILVGLAGSFLLWRRIVDMGKILKEKKRKGKLLLKQALDELTQWRKAYKEADAQSADMLNAIASF